jgi:hypothetical protein
LFSPNNNTPKTWWKVVVLNVGISQESRPWWPWQPIDINRWTIYIAFVLDRKATSKTLVANPSRLLAMLVVRIFDVWWLKSVMFAR